MNDGKLRIFDLSEQQNSRGEMISQQINENKHCYDEEISQNLTGDQHFKYEYENDNSNYRIQNHRGISNNYDISQVSKQKLLKQEHPKENIINTTSQQLNAHDYSKPFNQQVYLKHTKSNNLIDSPAKSDRSYETEKISTGSRSTSSNNTKSKLYDDAMHRLKKQEVLTILANQEQRKESNSSKIAVNSQKIILQRIQNYLKNLVESVSESDGNVIFEKIGYLLFQLGVFKCLEYQEDQESGELTINQLRQLSKLEIARMKQEIQLHEQLWNVLSLDQQQTIPLEQIQSISSSVLFDSLLVLLELKLTINQAQILLEQVLLANLFSDNQEVGTEILSKLSQTSTETQNSIENNDWSIHRLIKEFRKLFDDKTAIMESYAQYKQQNQLSAHSNSTAENSSIQSSPEMSFHPQINSRSRVMDSLVQQARNSSNKKRHELLFEHHSEQQERMNLQKSKSLKNEIATCTFTPQINKNIRSSSKTKKSRLRDDNRFLGGEQLQHEQQEININEVQLGQDSNEEQDYHHFHHDKLFSMHKKRQNQVKQLKEEVDSLRENKELETCTFKPQLGQINQEILNEGILLQQVKGLDEQLRRMNKARQARKEKEEFFQRQQAELAAAYERNQQNCLRVAEKKEREGIEGKKDKEETLANSKRTNQKRVLGYVLVNITKTKKARVVLREQDNAVELAQNFGRIYKISSDLIEALASLLQTYIDKFS